MTPTRLTPQHAIKFALLSGCAALLITGCKTAPGYTPAEQQMAAQMSPSNYQMRTQEERDAIETQDLFTQAAFWSREYDLNPADLEAAIKLSSVLRRMGNPTQALEIVQTARAMYPRDVTLVAELGANLIALERGKEAIQPLSGALRLAPGNARLYSLMGAAYDQIGDFGPARQYYNRAMSLSPYDANIVGNVGLSYALEGNPAEAERWLRRAANMPGASAHVRQNLALVLGIQGKYAEAEQIARQDLDPDAVDANMDYMRSLRGSSRSYSAISQGSSSAPQTQPPASGARQPIPKPPATYGAAMQQPYRPQPMASAPMHRPVQTQPWAPQRPIQRSYGGYPVTPNGQVPSQSTALPQGRQNVTQSGPAATGSSRDALLTAAQRNRSTSPQSAPPQAGQPHILDRIASSVGPNAPKPNPNVQMRQYPPQPNPYAQRSIQAQPQPQMAPGYYPQQPQQRRAPARRRG